MAKRTERPEKRKHPAEAGHDVEPGARGVCASDAEPPGHRRHVQLALLGRHHNAAAVLDGDAFDERAGERGRRLDQQNRPVAPVAQQAADALDLLDDRGLDALGGLVEDEALGRHDQRPGNGELLLIAA